MEQDIGDALEVLDEFNLVDLSKGLLRALNQAASSGASDSQLYDLQDRVVECLSKINELTALIAAVNEDHQKASRFLMNKMSGAGATNPQDGAGSGQTGGGL